MTNLHIDCIRSNIEVHGAQWAFEREYTRFLKAGRPERVAFALACNALFHRYIGA